MDAYWPVGRLRIVYDRLELRVPNEQELLELAREAAGEPYSAAVPMFSVRADNPVERARRTLQYFWKDWGCWDSSAWSLSLAAFWDGELVGVQNIRAKDFAEVREVETGSWVFADRRRQGLGSRMRAAILQLAFAGLGASTAISRTATSNLASLAVSEKLGYSDDGLEHLLADGEVIESRRLRLSKEDWLNNCHRDFIRLDALRPCLPQFIAGA